MLVGMEKDESSYSHIFPYAVCMCVPVCRYKAEPCLPKVRGLPTISLNDGISALRAQRLERYK